MNEPLMSFNGVKAITMPLYPLPGNLNTKKTSLATLKSLSEVAASVTPLTIFEIRTGIL